MCEVVWSVFDFNALGGETKQQATAKGEGPKAECSTQNDLLLKT